MSTLILQQSAVRWKEWLPLVTQQQRFRNLIQIIGFNIGLDEDNSNEPLKDISYYYTLHFSVMSAPFYSSEKMSKKHPRWSEIDFSTFDLSFGSAKGLVIRVWRHYQDEDTTVTVWGAYFSGLSYIGPYILPQENSAFAKNTLVFHMHGGYFTSPECLLNEPTLARITDMSLNQNDVRKSYTLDSLLRLHSIQRSIKEDTEKSVALHNEILMGEFLQDKSVIREASPFLRKLMRGSKPLKVSHEQILAVKRNIEMKKFQVQLLQEQKSFKLSELKKRKAYRNSIVEKNGEEDSKLRNSHETLTKDFDYTRDLKKSIVEGKDSLANLKSKFTFKEKELIAELAYIYPVENVGDKYTVCGVHLPNSEDFVGVNDVSLSVALGFTAHLVQIFSSIVDIPLRYPIIHFGSRSRILDHIADQIPDKDREFPLFIRGRDKLQFNYAVYLLNKNIAQLCWQYGIRTSDLRATLFNLDTLLNMHSKLKSDIKDSRLSSISRKTLQYNRSPGHFNLSKSDRLSRSLDRGLDRWEVADKNDPAKNTSEPTRRGGGPSSDSTDHDYSEPAFASEALRSNEEKPTVEEDKP